MPRAPIFRIGVRHLQRITPDGAAVSIHLARPGELFAEASLFSENYHCDTIAEVDSEIWLYPKDQISRSLHSEPDALWAFARELASRLQGSRLRYELKQIRSATERVLQLLQDDKNEPGNHLADGGRQRPPQALESERWRRHATPAAPVRKLPDFEQTKLVHIHIRHELRHAQGVDPEDFCGGLRGRALKGEEDETPGHP